MDAREVNLYAGRPLFIIRKPKPFSVVSFLGQVGFIAFMVWFWGGEALHKMELQWAQSNSGNSQALADFCKAAAAAPCDVYLHVALAHGIALTLLLTALKFTTLASSMPSWPRTLQKRLLQHPALIGGIGLLVTLALTVGRGVVAVLAAWYFPVVWTGSDSFAVPMASIIGLIAILRLPPHLKMIWELFSCFTRERTGREVSRNESPALWEMIDDACQRLGVKTPTHLVLGIFPDCRLEIGKMRLEPSRKVIDGHVLYLGATLSNSLDQEQLAQLIDHALLRSRGEMGDWMPAAEDWLESREVFLKDCKERHAAGELKGAVIPALMCWDGWLLIVKRMIRGFKAEYDFAQKAGIQLKVDAEAPKVRRLLDDAALAYRKDVFHIFIVNLTCGIVCPPVLSMFSRAFEQRHAMDSRGSPSVHTAKAINDELVLLEKEWLVKTSQASTPTDCWELRAA
ncbi:hypothetical protein BH11PSE11_BH11PSE11_14750 [soil metagenome]